MLFDHIGGINTLFHTLFNKGLVVAPENRSIDSILEICKKYEIELLPTTPTFLRLLLLSGNVPKNIPRTLKIITYGTEKMDQPTLDNLCVSLPWIDFRQTYGMSELGILRIKSESRNSLFMKIGGEGIKTKVEGGILFIKSETKMLGYLNSPSPFDKNGWYKTNDFVDTKKDLYKITGRAGDTINVGGLKFLPSDVEKVTLSYPGVCFAMAIGRENPITGQHVELKVEISKENIVNKEDLKKYLKKNLQSHMVPRRIIFEKIKYSHRFKKI